MEWLVWAGSALTLVGIAGLVQCIRLVVAARRAGLGDAALRARLQRIVALNFGALALSALGLGLVIVGVLLG